MATKYAVASGLWSSTATWSDTDGGAGGATLPADDDSVIISANVSVQMDTDLSAYTGLRTVSIRGHATTPGMLYFKDGASGYLKIRTGYNLDGAGWYDGNESSMGRLLVNSDGVWGNTGALDFSTKAIISLGATSSIIGEEVKIALYCTNPATLYVRTYGTKYDFTASGATVDVTNNTIDLGTTPPTNGTLVMITTSGGTLPGGLLENIIYTVVSVSGTTCKLQCSRTIDITSTGSGTCTLFTGHTNTGTATMNVLDDITADAAWVTTTDHNRACLVSRPSATDPFDDTSIRPDQQRITLSYFSPTTITLSANVDSVQLPGARIAITSRNVSIRSATTSISQKIIDYQSDASFSGVFQCEIVATAGTGTTFYGIGISYGANHFVNGTIMGCYYGIEHTITLTTNGIITCCQFGVFDAYNNPDTFAPSVVNGLIMGCQYGLYQTTYSTINANIFGCAYGIYEGYMNEIDGTIEQTHYSVDSASHCTFNGRILASNYQSNAIYGKGFFCCSSILINGQIIGCYKAVENCKNCTLSLTGIISFCTYAFISGPNARPQISSLSLSSAGNNIINGEISYCTVAFRGEEDALLNHCAIGYTLSGVSAPNGSDFNFTIGSNTIGFSPSRVFGRGVLTSSPPAIASADSIYYADVSGEEGIFFEDYLRVSGAFCAFLSWGQLIKNTTTVRPSGSGQSIEVIPYYQCAPRYPIKIFEWTELSVDASSQTKSIYVKGEGWTTFPTSSELYFEAEYISNGTTLVTSTIASTQVLTDNTTWTQLSVTFTPAAAGHVRYRAYLKLYEAACKVYVDNKLV